MGEKSRKDPDDVILNFFGARSLSPRELSRGCQPKEMSRATYFRHKKKLIDQLRIEQIARMNEDGKMVELLRRVPSGELADSRDIEQLLEEIENSDEVISSQGLRDLHKLCENRRVAYYFSPQNGPRFKTNEEVELFFEQELLNDTPDRRLEFLKIIFDILRLEKRGSLWKRNLLQRCHNPIEKLAWEESDSEIRAWSIEILTRISDEDMYSNQALLDLGYSIIKSRISDENFVKLLEKVKKLLIKRKSAVESRHKIRRKLNEIAVKNPIWKKRVEMVLA